MNELENVKVGDKLLARNYYQERIETVVKVTKTLVVAQQGRRYRKRDGRGLPIERGYSTYAKPATQLEIERVAKANARIKNIRICKDTDYGKLTDEQIERIVNIIKE